MKQKYLYFNKKQGRWCIQYKSYICSRKNKEEILPIYDECCKCNWDVHALAEIKKKYAVYSQSYGRGITKMKDGYFTLYVYPPDGGKQYAGRYASLAEAECMRRRIIDSGYCLDPVNHRSGGDGNFRYVYERGGKYIIIRGGEYFGMYSSLEDALCERDLLESVDWSWDELDGV